MQKLSKRSYRLAMAGALAVALFNNLTANATPCQETHSPNTINDETVVWKNVAFCQLPSTQLISANDKPLKAEKLAFDTPDGPFIVVMIEIPSGAEVELASYVTVRENTEGQSIRPKLPDYHAIFNADISVAVGFVEGYSPLVPAGLLRHGKAQVSELKPKEKDRVIDSVICVGSNKIEILRSDQEIPVDNDQTCVQIGPLIVENSKPVFSKQSARDFDIQDNRTSKFAHFWYWRSFIGIAKSGNLVVGVTSPIGISELGIALASNSVIELNKAVSVSTNDSASMVVNHRKATRIFRQKDGVTPAALIVRIK